METSQLNSGNSTERGTERYTLQGQLPLVLLLSLIEKPEAGRTHKGRDGASGAQARVKPCVRNWGEQKPWAGIRTWPGSSACRVRACKLEGCGDCQVWAADSLGGFSKPSLGGTDGLRIPAALPAAAGMVRKRTLAFSLHKYREESEIRPPYINPYYNRQVTQEFKTKRRDSRINVHCCSEQKLNSKQ